MGGGGGGGRAHPMIVPVVRGGGGPPQGTFLEFLPSKSPFLGFRVIQTRYWPVFNLESVFIIKNILL